MSLNIQEISRDKLSIKTYFDGHEKVYYFSDIETKLEGFIAIHNTNLGPAVGGTRMRQYFSQEEALSDALLLSKAMSYKCALAKVPYGGGKTVIIGNPKIKDESLLRAYGQMLATLDCSFRTGVDVGMTDEDVKNISQYNTCMIGVLDPTTDKMHTADMAALSVFVSIQASVKKMLGKRPSETNVAVKGLGKLGSELVRLLSAEGYRVVAADIDESRNQKIKELFPSVTIVDQEVIHKVSCDVFSPCALGNELNEETVDELNTKIICGGANNQLSSDIVGIILHQKNILYCPDYLVNAGGLINVVDELENDGYKKERVKERVQQCGIRMSEIIDISIKEKRATSLVADTLARSILYKK